LALVRRPTPEARRWQVELIRALEVVRSPLLDTVFYMITMLGEETVVIVLLCAVYWCIDKRAAYVIGVSYFLSGLIVQGMKVGFRIERPWVIDPTLHPVGMAISGATGYSFPSGHTQSATALFGALAMRLKAAPAKVACCLAVLLVGFSRLYLGVHTLADVIASLAITSLVAWGVSRLMHESGADRDRSLAIALAVVAAAVTAVVVVAMPFADGLVEQGYLADCLKTAGAGAGFAIGMCIERSYIRFTVLAKGFVWQVAKLALGIVGVLVIKEGLKLVLGSGFVVDAVRYLLVCLWVTVFYPLAIKRWLSLAD
jgi:membrane-associated phospholipid phosphatase